MTQKDIFDIDMIREVYQGFKDRVNNARQVVGKPLTFTEKSYF